MIDALAVAGSYDGGDQGFLNTFFADWYAMPVMHRLPVGYNMAHFIYQFLRGHPTLEETLERETKIVHYMVQKPWEVKATLTGGSVVARLLRSAPRAGAGVEGEGARLRGLDLRPPGVAGARVVQREVRPAIARSGLRRRDDGNRTRKSARAARGRA